MVRKNGRGVQGGGRREENGSGSGGNGDGEAARLADVPIIPPLRRRPAGPISLRLRKRVLPATTTSSSGLSPRSGTRSSPATRTPPISSAVPTPASPNLGTSNNHTMGKAAIGKPTEQQEQKQ
ncbi:uncharacterized protein LOC120107813 [Phoenix dactylifera]|uniref:Uncharacterized protein LOC120105844 n=1 Tax=Phoenix dactylifera TaxID=42345 RepID=A0A8B8ZV09_PHODC|nr:uncharacterized protein LOC120105844 [Phoenix dactylifera]XP_038977202.1 uncharacterized protein LOC120107813 [Phoenix dactylifera]